MTALGLLPLPELSVLAPRDPSITEPDDWPEFRLHDAFAILPGTKDNANPVSLLLASEHYPLTVMGRLAPPTVDKEHLWLRKDVGKKGIPVILEDVRSFAYGAYEDGSVEIWAAGKAGWFVIQPGRAGRMVYHNMCAAVKMLFFIVDAYTEPEQNRKGKSAQEWSEPNAEQVFQKYAREVLGDEARSSEAAEAVYKHRDFLMASMLAGKEGVAWSRNPLFRHLSRKFADELKAIRERSAPAVQPPGKASSKAGARARQDSIDSASTSSSLKRKRGRPPKNRSADVISIASSTAASSLKKDLLQRPASARSEPQKARQTAKPTPALPTRRTRNRSQSIPPRSATPEIQESATPAQDSDSDDDDVPARAAGKGISALRLKPSKPMQGPPRQPPKSNKALVQDEDEEPRSSPIPSKRRADEPTAAYPRRAKRRNSKTAEEDEGIDIPSSPSSPPSDPDPDTSAGALQHPDLSTALAAHKPDPLQDRTWLCALDGCTHKIYGDPSDPSSQRLIREHYALHAYDDDERVQLVKRLQAPSLPVGHLMERVRVAAKGEGFPGSRVAGTRFPEGLGRGRY